MGRTVGHRFHSRSNLERPLQFQKLMTIFEELRKEHDGIRRLLARISKTPDHASREGLFECLAEEWEEHSSLEETSIYQFLRESGIQEEVLRCFEEHLEMEALFRELRRMVSSDPLWLREFERLKATLLEHMRQEERSFFQHAGTHLSDSEKVQLLSEHLAERSRQRARRQNVFANQDFIH